MIAVLEVLAFLFTFILAIAWLNDSGGNYEPLTVLCGLVFVGSEIFRRNRAKDKAEEKEGREDSQPLQESQEKSVDKQSLPHSVDSCSFFADRFAQAFPGVREITWYSPNEAVARLSKLFEQPFIYQGDNEAQTPIWWFRDGNMGIDDFRVIDKQSVLLDHKELRIRRLAAIPARTHYRQFVYLEASPMSPTGLYPNSHEEEEKAIEAFGYSWEEYGLYKGKHPITRSEYDDNAAMIGGKLVRLGNDAEIRTRYTSPYNLIIAPHESPINNGEFDRKLVEKLNEMLQEHTKIAELNNMVGELPRDPRMCE